VPAKPAFSALFILLVLQGCASSSNPFEQRPADQRIQEVQAIALNLAFEDFQLPTAPSPEVRRRVPVCLGVGQRGPYSNHLWLPQNPREERWNPQPYLTRRIDVTPPGRIVPLSDCLRDGNDREILAADGSPAVTWFVSDPSWTTPDAVRVTISIRGLGQFGMSYSVALRRRGGTWDLHRFTCLWAGKLCEHFR